MFAARPSRRGDFRIDLFHRELVDTLSPGALPFISSNRPSKQALDGRLLVRGEILGFVNHRCIHLCDNS